MSAENRSVTFFEAQFRRQAEAGEFALNPFETLALPYVQGDVLDLGCGLGNLALEAARRGANVLALDASATAVAHLHKRADAAHLPVRAVEADLSAYRIAGSFDTIIAIGLAMFFPKPRALELVDDIRAHVRPGGIAIVNVLVEGTTYLDMFEPGRFYLFGDGELDEHFAGWEILESRRDRFEASGGTVKAFATIVARKSP